MPASEETTIAATIEDLTKQLEIEKAQRLSVEELLRGVESARLSDQAVKPERPPKFHGKEGERADTWLFLNKQYFISTGLMRPLGEQKPENIRQCILLAASGLRDNAAVWWQHTLQVSGGINMHPTWEVFEAAVKAEFQPLDSEKAARDKLADLVQTRSVAAYVGVLRDLALQIPDLSTGDLLHKFTRGLKTHIRKEVELRDPQTLDEAIRMAERADAIEYGTRYPDRRRQNYQGQGHFYGGQQRPQNFQQGYRPQNRYNGPQPMELGAMQGNHTGGRRPDDRRRDLSQVVCWNCHRKGHTARVCRFPAATDRSTKGGRQ